MSTREEEIASRATHYIRNGMAPESAIDRAILEDTQPGLGQATPGLISTVEADVATINTEVSPWLWILSVGGFIMSMYSKYQISKMFGSWSRAKKKYGV